MMWHSPIYVYTSPSGNQAIVTMFQVPYGWDAHQQRLVARPRGSGQDQLVFHAEGDYRLTRPELIDAGIAHFQRWTVPPHDVVQTTWPDQPDWRAGIHAFLDRHNAA